MKQGKVSQKNLKFKMKVKIYKIHFCYNPSLGLATKAKACKGVGQV
jgi:hypothetical protein